MESFKSFYVEILSQWFSFLVYQAECNAENESCHLISDLSKDAGYLGDLETSSSEPPSPGSEDDISIASKRGISLFMSDHFTNTPQTAHSIGSKVFFATSLILKSLLQHKISTCFKNKNLHEAHVA